MCELFEFGALIVWPGRPPRGLGRRTELSGGGAALFAWMEQRVGRTLLGGPENDGLFNNADWRFRV